MAIDADWERAWRLDAPQCPSDREIAYWARGQGAAVAIEVFFPTLDGRLIYYGERLRSNDANERLAFLTGFITAAFTAENALRVLARNSVQDAASEPCSLDIGVADCWSGLGNHQVWSAGVPTAFAPLAVRAAMETYPAIRSNAKNYQVLVLTLKGQPSSWIGIDVSASASAPFHLSQARVKWVWNAFLS